MSNPTDLKFEVSREDMETLFKAYAMLLRVATDVSKAESPNPDLIRPEFLKSCAGHALVINTMLHEASKGAENLEAAPELSALFFENGGQINPELGDRVILL